MEENQTPDSELLLEDPRQATQELLVEDGMVLATPSELKKAATEFKATLTAEDILAEEAAAAGIEAGDAGHSFVDIIRIVEGVPNAQYGFPLNPTLEPPTLNGEAQASEKVKQGTLQEVTSDEPQVPSENSTPSTPPDEEPEEQRPEDPEGPVEPEEPEDDPDPEGPPEDPEEPEDPVDPTGGNNGWGNGDQDAPGNSGDHNNAENNNSGTSNPSHGNNSNTGNSNTGSNGSNSSQGNDETTDNNPEEDATNSESEVDGDSNSDGSNTDTDSDDSNTNPKGNNGFGNGDQEAPGNSLNNNNAENAGGTSATLEEYPGNSLHLNDIIHINNGNGNQQSVADMVELLTLETFKGNGHGNHNP